MREMEVKPLTSACKRIGSFLLTCALALPSYAAPLLAGDKQKGVSPLPAPCASANCTAQSKPLLVVLLPSEDETTQKELAPLARALMGGARDAYDSVASFSRKHESDVWGARAALALGYYDYTKSRSPLALAWLEKADRDPLIREYVLYWRARAKRALGRDAEALTDLKTLRAEFPDGAMTELTVEALAESALAAGKPSDAVAALDAYPGTASKSNLLLERARARQAAKQLARAAADYQALYYKYPLSDEARSAGPILAQLAKRLRDEFPRATAAQQEDRAQAFFDGKKWREARQEFEKLLAMLGKKDASPRGQRARLRIAQARVQMNGSPKLIEAVRCPDPEVDAERLYVLSQAWRPRPYDTRRGENEMLAALDLLAQKYPSSRWNEDGMFARANHYWVQLDRRAAAEAYQRLLEKFPGTRYAQTAQWRIAWAAYLERRPEAREWLEAFVSKYPGSSYVVDALYWLGRVEERAGNVPHARSFYRKAEERFPQTYFGRAAAARLDAIGREQVNPAEFLEKIPPAPALRRLDEAVPAAALERWTRAQVLRTLAFDASAELELRAGYLATGSPRFAFEAAQAAIDQSHFNVAMALGRIAIPNAEARKKEDVPVEAWKILFPLPYEAAVRRESAKNGVDAMLVAGLMRQESTFQPDALSRAGAVGLMQVLPKTGRKLARQLRVRYSRAKLYEPEYNLRFGTLYLADLLKAYGSAEAALAAFNAGEDRVEAWQAERKFEELAEFVESVPFTETREYIQIVLRNAEVYRMIYGTTGERASGRGGRQ